MTNRHPNTNTQRIKLRTAVLLFAFLAWWLWPYVLFRHMDVVPRESPWQHTIRTLSVVSQLRMAQLTPLRSDGWMIHYLDAHRTEFDDLVRLWKSESKGLSLGSDQAQLGPSTRELLARLDVKWVRDAGLWRENPYSPATKEIVHDEIKRGRYRELCIERCILEIRLSGYRYESPSLGYGVVRKEYIRYPAPPIVDKDGLWDPSDSKGRIQKKQVASALISTPLSPAIGQCIYRRVDPQWFIRLCRSY